MKGKIEEEKGKIEKIIGNRTNTGEIRGNKGK